MAGKERESEGERIEDRERGHTQASSLLRKIKQLPGMNTMFGQDIFAHF